MSSFKCVTNVTFYIIPKGRPTHAVYYWDKYIIRRKIQIPECICCDTTDFLIGFLLGWFYNFIENDKDLKKYKTADIILAGWEDCEFDT